MLSPWHVKIVVKVHGEEDLVREAGFRTRLGAKQLVASIAMNQLEALYKAITKLGRYRVRSVQLRENKVQFSQNALKLFLEDIFRRDFF